MNKKNFSACSLGRKIHNSIGKTRSHNHAGPSISTSHIRLSKIECIYFLSPLLSTIFLLWSLCLSQVFLSLLLYLKCVASHKVSSAPQESHDGCLKPLLLVHHALHVKRVLPRHPVAQLTINAINIATMAKVIMDPTVVDV